MVLEGINKLGISITKFEWRNREYVKGSCLKSIKLRIILNFSAQRNSQLLNKFNVQLC